MDNILNNEQIIVVQKCITALFPRYTTAQIINMKVLLNSIEMAKSKEVKGVLSEQLIAAMDFEPYYNDIDKINLALWLGAALNLNIEAFQNQLATFDKN